jgi:phosphate/sulfate permease
MKRFEKPLMAPRSLKGLRKGAIVGLGLAFLLLLVGAFDNGSCMSGPGFLFGLIGASLVLPLLSEADTSFYTYIIAGFAAFPVAGGMLGFIFGLISAYAPNKPQEQHKTKVTQPV